MKELMKAIDVAVEQSGFAEHCVQYQLVTSGMTVVVSVLVIVFTLVSWYKGYKYNQLGTKEQDDSLASEYFDKSSNWELVALVFSVLSVVALIVLLVTFPDFIESIVFPERVLVDEIWRIKQSLK